MQKNVNICTKYAKICKNMDLRSYNLKINKYVKYEQVAYRARGLTTVVRPLLKYAILHISHIYEKNVIKCKIWDRSPYECR